VSAELTAENGHQLFVPEGFAHGFCTLENNTEILYKVSQFYSPRHEGGIRWDDPQLSIPWPVDAASIVVSEKDAALPFLREWTSPFAYDGSELGHRSLLA
jgi:dTDP-4-dehydrorhamnose 3,5-epimerase